MQLTTICKPVQFELAWWVEITANYPLCTYYFGPFSSVLEAQANLAGYIEDLQQDGHKEIRHYIKWCRPQELTISPVE